MRNIAQKAKSATKQTAQQAAQMAAQRVKQESLETLKSGREQAAGRAGVTDRQGDPSIVNYLREQTAANADAGEMREDIEAQSKQQYMQWQNKLEEIRQEEDRAQQQAAQQQRHVVEIQQERMQELTPQKSEAPAVAQGKPQKGKGKGMRGRAKKAVSGVKNAIEQKMKKRETGRGAKG